MLRALKGWFLAVVPQEFHPDHVDYQVVPHRAVAEVSKIGKL